MQGCDMKKNLTIGGQSVQFNLCVVVKRIATSFWKSIKKVLLQKFIMYDFQGSDY